MKLSFRKITNNLKRLVKDKAVVFGISQKLWIFLSAALTAPLILIFFSPVFQGYYYTFVSLLGIQTLFIMGIDQLIQQFVSHEWAKLQFIPGYGISGDEKAVNRLASIKQFTVKWYSWMSLAMFFGLGVGGFLFLKYSASGEVLEMSVWLAPWIGICFLKSLQTLLSPGLKFLEGINEVNNVYKFRFSQSVYERIASWIVMILGGKLWLLAGGTAVYLIGQIRFLGRKYFNILREIFNLKAPENNIWREEILPLQWKYALSSVSGYLNFTFVIPLVFWFLGPIEAGKLGITWSIITKFWDLFVPLISTRMPLFTMHAAKSELTRLNELFKKAVLQSTGLLVLMIALFLLLLGILDYFLPSIAERFIEILPAVLISIAVVLHHLRFAMVNYMRTLKKEPFWKISVLDILLFLVVLPPLCIYFGIIGVSFGLLGVISINTSLTYFIFAGMKSKFFNDN